MKAKKIIVTIKVEVLEREVIPSMVEKMIQQTRYADCPAGMIRTNSGDQIDWETTHENVEF